MAMVRISLLGLEKYAKAHGESLFSGLSLPKDLTNIDYNTLINNILLDAADFEVLYPNPDMLRQAISLWSMKNQETFKRLYTALFTEYNPIENYDRYESYTDTKKESATDTNEESSTASNKTQNGSTSHDTEYNRVYETGVLQSGNEQNNTGSMNGSSSSETSLDSNQTHQIDGTNTHEAHLHGNIGVTTNVDMLTQELKFRCASNFYNLVSTMFLQEFCIMVY